MNKFAKIVSIRMRCGLINIVNIHIEPIIFLKKLEILNYHVILVVFYNLEESIFIIDQ